MDKTFQLKHGASSGCVKRGNHKKIKEKNPQTWQWDVVKEKR